MYHFSARQGEVFSLGSRVFLFDNTSGVIFGLCLYNCDRTSKDISQHPKEITIKNRENQTNIVCGMKTFTI